MQTNIRPATMFELDRLNTMIKKSALDLSQGYYNDNEIESLNTYVFGADSDLIADQTYYAVERGGIIVACGGWSRRATLFGGDRYHSRDTKYLDPATDAAKIRAFFVHPDYARQGIATMLMRHCENAAREFGFRRLELMSTLPGVPFYLAHGFEGENVVELTIENGVKVKLRPMVKHL